MYFVSAGIVWGGCGFHPFSSTSPPGGNQVDGLPPVCHTGSVVMDVPGQPRRLMTFDDGNVHNFLSADSLLVLLHSKLLNYI